MREDELNHDFGVHIANDVDKLRLEYLLNVIGPQKLFNSVRKYNQRYPESEPFVSTLLRWHRVRVPSACYASKLAPRYHVYLLALANFGGFKVGVSGQWERRVLAFSPTHSLKEFDLDYTRAMPFSDKQRARRAEQVVKSALLPYKVVAPEFVPFGAYGHQEWLSANAYPQAVQLLQRFESDIPRSWVEWHPPVPFQYAWEYEDILSVDPHK